MKNILRLSMLAMAFGFIFIAADSVNAQVGQRNRQARREYRSDVREARKDYRRRANTGNYRKARREYREDIRDARKDYRQDTGRRRTNRGYYVSRSRRAYPQQYRVYYRNGRRYVVRNY